jgi:hypothetical protein
MAFTLYRPHGIRRVMNVFSAHLTAQRTVDVSGSAAVPGSHVTSRVSVPAAHKPQSIPLLLYLLYSCTINARVCIKSCCLLCVSVMHESKFAIAEQLSVANKLPVVAV